MATKILRTVEERSLALFGKGLIQPAVDVLEVELTQSPDQGHLWELSAIFLHAQRRWKESLHAAETASMLVSLSVAGQLVMADDYSFLGKNELATLLYRHILSLDSLPPRFFPSLYAGFQREGLMKESLYVCRKATEQSPEDDEAFFGMAHCLAQLSYPSRMVETALRKAFHLAPEKPHYRLSLALQLLVMNRKRQAYVLLTGDDSIILQGIECEGCARKFLELCVSAGDSDRAAVLGGLLATFKNNKNVHSKNSDIHSNNQHRGNE